MNLVLRAPGVDICSDGSSDDGWIPHDERDILMREAYQVPRLMA